MTAAERQRRAYIRRCLGRIVAPVEIDATIADMLTDLGWSDADTFDRAAIGEAISGLLHHVQHFLTREPQGARLRAILAQPRRSDARQRLQQSEPPDSRRPTAKVR
jgi:hypothetical protein